MNSRVYSIDEIKRLLYEILSNTEVERAILFGSYAKNESTEDSDIDIVIDSKGKVNGLKFFLIMDMIKEKFQKEVDVIEQIEIEENSRIDEEIKKTGVIVYEKQR